MRINFEKAAAAQEELGSFAAKIGMQAESLRNILTVLSENSGTDELVVRLKKVIDKMDSQQFRAKMMGKAIHEVTEVYLQGEQRIILNSENGAAPKAAVQPVTAVRSAAGFDWSIR